MISYAARRRAVLRAERLAAVRRQMRAAIVHLEAVAAGEGRGRFGMTPERAADYLANGLPPDPPPAQIAERGEPAQLPAYMPAGAPRPMSVRGTVRALNHLGSRVPLRLVLTMLRLKLCQLGARLMSALAELAVPLTAAIRSHDLPLIANPSTGPPAWRPASEAPVISP